MNAWDYEDADAALNKIARALATDYFCIYCVNLETDDFIEYSSHDNYQKLGIENKGTDFFGLARKDIVRVVYHDDVEKLYQGFTKENIIDNIEKRGAFTIKYRLLIDNVPTYVSLKATYIALDENKKKYAVIGINNIDAQIKREKEALTYEAIAKSLVVDYFSIYYVNLNDETFVEYSTFQGYEALGVENDGKDFFNLSRKNALKIIYHDDLVEFLTKFTKENILNTINEHKAFTLRYRLALENGPEYVSMKITKIGDDHIVMGISNIDTEVREKARSVTFSSIAEALAYDYFAIYYVNILTDEYIEYQIDKDNNSLGNEKDGKDFFGFIRKTAIKNVYNDDIGIILSEFKKENILNRLNANGKFTLKFRMMIDDTPKYVSLKVTKMIGEDNPYIVVGINNIDAQIKREEELQYAREKAYKDSLTGVKSKHAFTDAEDRYNNEIKENKNLEFAVAVFDVNNLKQINDNLGHKAGDKLIQDACKIICDSFDHSPVYRIGGDEFVAIISGTDFNHLDMIVNDFKQGNIDRKNNNENPVISIGVKVYNKDEDNTFEDVLKQADALMYENKKSLK